ncbi:uncharacterized protein LOC109861978 [Pseudomyrmex gracilis]|uniref:uncharacterized protein LOC109861978 n=1 Tax=Pseudomyrmex gracilis TaxID=219809 RepID=UPI000995A512|nr:uncharacterized protein LOC109861978 [Pseudomyrmex gracilis]
MTLDERWTFRNHFQNMINKGRRVLAALARIMPNLGRPKERRRQLYLHVLHVVILYGAHVWADEFVRDKKAMSQCRRIHKQITARVICAYRIVSADAALLLARAPPFELLARERTMVYEKLRAEGDIVDYNG